MKDQEQDIRTRTVLFIGAVFCLAVLGPYVCNQYREPTRGDRGDNDERARSAPLVVVDADRNSRSFASDSSGEKSTGKATGRWKGLPGSLRDTDTDGSLDLDGDGHFIPNRNALFLFDYFLIASGEEPLEDILARIEDVILESLPPEAAREALAFLDTYMDYRERARELYFELGADGSLEARFARIREFRREAFGAELADRLFSDEEAASQIALERTAIVQDESLSDEEKWEQINALEENLPDGQQGLYQKMLAPAELSRTVEAMREAGASNEEVQEARAQELGPEAADRLAALDVKRSQWNERLENYRNERTRIEADPSLDDQQRQAQIELLLEEHFEGPEILRAKALERIAAKDPETLVD